MEQLVYLFSGLRWQDVFDIILISYILFRLYVLFRGTKVIRSLLGICVLWAAGQGAVYLGLIVTNWAMQGIITVAAFLVIIVFRNEIASVLQTKDLKSFLWGIPQYQFHTPLSIIAQSVHELALNKIGALIVLPLKQGLGGVVQGGIPIKCALSSEMLTSIFWPGNPVHDGAAVIHGNQIKTAGAILPLSKREDLPFYFGTRHRAASGLTEFTDAVIIVVSEERGKITLFQENHVESILDQSMLEQRLQDYTGADTREKGVRRQTVELVTAAMISLFCVSGIWFNFSKGMETLAEHEIPLEFTNPDQKMEIISSSASSVKLLISGARPLINSFKPEQIKINLNLSESGIGVNKLPVTRDNILLPPGIQLKKIDPPELDITLDTMIEKQLPIQPHWTGKLPKGLIMTSATVTPQTIKVSGGGLALENISTIFTEKIPLNKLSKSGTVTTALVLSPDSLKLAEKKKIQIQYTILDKK